MTGSGIKFPFCRLMAYSDSVPGSKLATNTQLSSLRIAMELAPPLAEMNGGVSAVKEPVAEEILNWEIRPDAVSTTYKKLPYASSAKGPGPSPGETGKGEPLTASSLKSTTGQFGCDMELQIA